MKPVFPRCHTITSPQLTWLKFLHQTSYHIKEQEGFEPPTTAPELTGWPPTLSLPAIVLWYDPEGISVCSTVFQRGSDYQSDATFCVNNYHIQAPCVQFSYAVAVFSWVALLTYSILEYDSSNRAVKPPVVIPTLDCEVDVEDYHSVNY